MISFGSVRLNTPPTGFLASSSLIWPSESSWIWSSFSCSVICLSSSSTRRSTFWFAAPRLGASAASSLDCVAATTPPATTALSTTVAIPVAILPLRMLMVLPL